MEAILQSFLLVAASEMGDKTQLLALVLTLRFRQPLAIMSGILGATILNHGISSLLGDWISKQIDPQTMRYVLSFIFVAFALWILVPDKDDENAGENRYGAFLTTLVTFFFAEMGDKTQLATIALGAKFQSPWLVTIGTTVGMMFSDGLAVAFGERFTQKIPLKTVRIFASISFAIFGGAILLGL